MYTFDALEFAIWMRARWAVIAISCGVAILLAVTFSLAQPSRYTATATVIIQSPGGNDPRAALGVSPVYRESLKSYERFALSDTLFLRAMEKVPIREGSSGSAESLKRQVLKVSRTAGVALLEISATLQNPREALALARYIAEQTAELNRSLIAQSGGAPPGTRSGHSASEPEFTQHDAQRAGCDYHLICRFPDVSGFPLHEHATDSCPG